MHNTHMGAYQDELWLISVIRLSSVCTPSVTHTHLKGTREGGGDKINKPFTLFGAAKIRKI